MASIGSFLSEASERLTPSNYSIWKVRMESILVLQDVMDIILGIEEEPQVFQQSIKYKKRSMTALHCIKMNVSNEISREIGGCSSTKEAWDALQAIYESKNTSRLLIVLNRTSTCKILI